LLSFPPFQLDLDAGRLWKNEQELHLRRKPFAILCYLVQNPDRLVTRDEIVDAVWGPIAMSDSLLRTHLRDLRRTMGESVVETVLGRGYRFLPEVKVVAPAGGEAEVSSQGLFVGRDPELQALRASFGRVRERLRTAVFLTGEAGIGKTTLTDVFLAQVREQATVLVGRGACVEQLGSGQVYLPVLDAIGALCRGPTGAHVVGVLSTHAPSWLVQMPALVRRDQLEELQRRAAGATQARMLRELAEALDALSERAPVILVLEDLQWADPATAELVAILCSRRESARFFLLGTYRAAEVHRGDAVARVVGELMAHRRACSMKLEGFGVEVVEAYLARRFPGHEFSPVLAATLHRSTGGNPLFLTTLADDLEERSIIRRSDEGWELTMGMEDVGARNPDSVRRLIDMQIDRLSPTEQRILEVASVAGETFYADAVAHALEVDADHVDSCCELLVHERSLLRHLGSETLPDGTLRSRYAFRHALFRHAAMARSPSARVRVWRRKMSERLPSGGARIGEEAAA
jgi:predicted ATPase